MPDSNTQAAIDSLSQASTTDKSIGFFNDVFGIGWEKILDGTNSAGGSGNVLFEMFFAFNAVILACVMVLMFYVITTGVIGTAHEGESLGKRYSTLWTPIRGALAVSLLMPLPWAKLSLLQALILKLIFFSIGGASYLADKTVDFMVTRGGAMTMPAAPTVQAQPLALELLKNLVIQEYFSQREGYSGIDGINEGNSKSHKSFTFKSPSFFGTSQGMATISVSCGDTSNSYAATYCQAEFDAVKSLMQGLKPIAKALVSQYNDGANTKISDGLIQSSFYTPIKTYAAASQTAATNALKDFGAKKNAKLENFKESIKNNGWTWLGVYYWKLASLNDEAYQAIAVKAGVSSQSKVWLINITTGARNEFDITMKRFGEFAEFRNAGRVNQQSVAASGDAVGGWSLVGSLLWDGLLSSLGEETAMSGSSMMLSKVIARGDPVYNLQCLGHQLINASGIMIIAGGALEFIGPIAGFLGKHVPVLGSVASFVGGSQEKSSEMGGGLFAKFGGWVVTIAIMLLIVSLTLAYYLPAVPFILWISAIVGWLVLCMEIMVAAPVWAAMHAIPEGEGMAGQHGRKGYILLFGILLRPSLHVVGFFMSFILIMVVGRFIGEAYIDYAAATESTLVDVGGPFGPIAHLAGWFTTLIIGIGLIISLSHKVFGLITWLPDNILRWAGDGMGSLNEHQDENKTNTVVGAGSVRLQSALQATQVTDPNKEQKKKDKQGESPIRSNDFLQGDR